jgi:hypothetical protein
MGWRPKLLIRGGLRARIRGDGWGGELVGWRRRSWVFVIGPGEEEAAGPRG